MFAFRTLVIAALLASASTAFAGPKSLTKAVRTGWTEADVTTLRAIAWALGSVGGQFGRKLSETSAEDCQLSLSCAEQANLIVANVAEHAFVMSIALEEAMASGPDQAGLDALIAEQRTLHLDPMAQLQFELLQVIKAAPGRSIGNGFTDKLCMDFYDLYWQVVTRMVEINPIQAGFGGGRGTDD